MSDDDNEYFDIFEQLERQTTERTNALVRTVTLNEALDSYDLVKAVHDPIGGSYVVMAERNPKLLMCEYGYMPLEKVYGINSDGKIVLKKLAPRHPLDIMQWDYDITGGPNGIIMDPTQANGFESTFIPIEKLVTFVLEQEAGDMRGISILRSAYKHYYYKDTLYKIDAIQKERHGIGVPIIKLPLGYTATDRALADDLGRNLRTNELAHITVPINWEVAF